MHQESWNITSKRINELKILSQQHWHQSSDSDTIVDGVATRMQKELTQVQGKTKLDVQQFNKKFDDIRAKLKHDL